MNEKNLRISIIIALSFIAPGALWAGYSFMADSSGALIGMDISYLQHSPFANYFIPGMILFVANGLLNVVAIILALLKNPKFPYLAFVQGSILVGWIAIQVAMVRDFNVLHLTCLLFGIYILVAGIILIKK